MRGRKIWKGKITQKGQAYKGGENNKKIRIRVYQKDKEYEYSWRQRVSTRGKSTQKIREFGYKKAH